MRRQCRGGVSPPKSPFVYSKGACPLVIICIALCSCVPYRYVSIETYNSAAITFPQDMRRLLITNNALPQDEVPFETSIIEFSEEVKISTDSVAFDFCRTLGEMLADFQGFDDVRLLEGCLRKDMSPFTAPVLGREEVELLCDEHAADVIISLDRLLFKLKEHETNMFSFQMQDMIDVEISGVLRVYAPGREKPMTTLLLSDTLMVDTGFEYNYPVVRDLLLSDDEPNLLRLSASYIAEEARKHFVPFWDGDVRWYYTAYGASWKEATAYAESEKWAKALEIWTTLYERTASWKQKARLCSNMALGHELMGNSDQALQYAKQSHQLMLDHAGADDPYTKKQEVYVNVLTARIAEEQKLQLQN